VTVFGQVIVVVNSHAALKELVLGTRTSVLSGRPSITFADMYTFLSRFIMLLLIICLGYRTGMSGSLPMRPYDKVWRDGRRVVDNHFRAASLQPYQHVQKENVALAMKRLVLDPVRYVQHIRQYVIKFFVIRSLTRLRYAGAIVLSIVYGYDVKESDDPWIAVAEEANELGSRYLLPGALMVNMLPFCACSLVRCFLLS
jgi:hypothetical protein